MKLIPSLMSNAPIHTIYKAMKQKQNPIYIYFLLNYFHQNSSDLSKLKPKKKKKKLNTSISATRTTQKKKKFSISIWYTPVVQKRSTLELLKSDVSGNSSGAWYVHASST